MENMGLVQITIFIPRELELKAIQMAEQKLTSKSQLCRQLLCTALKAT